jgi:amidohydrolase
MDIKKQILEKAEYYFNTVVDIRRHLHRHPELSFQEHNTIDYLESRLNNEGIKFEKPLETGITGMLKGNSSGKPVVALQGRYRCPAHPGKK